MAPDDVAAVAADDDFDVTADLAAAFDAAEAAPEPGKEPATETAEQASERARDEKGRFASQDGDKGLAAQAKEPGAAEAAATKPEAAAPKPEQQLLPERQELADPIKPPPPGFSPTAKVVWDKEALSKDEWEAVKRDIVKRNDEVGKGLAELTEYKPIKQYAEMAKRSGTTLEKALENYTGIEHELGRDMVSGVARICQNQGVHPVALANAILARHGASAQPDGTGDPQTARQPAGADPATVQRIAALENILQQHQSAGVQSELQRFASDPKHTFFENVRTDMGRLMNSGYAESMEDAYDKACWANPEIRNLLIKQQSAPSDPSAKVAAATQARAASKSITGSPIPNASAKGPETSLEEEIRQLMDASV